MRGNNMNYLLARIRDRKNGLRKILSNEKIYELPNTLDSAIAYSPDDSLEDSEWFYINNFSKQAYCLEFLKLQVNGASYTTIQEEEFKLIAFLCSIQDTDLYYFQRISKSQLVQHKRLAFGTYITYEDNAKEIIVKEVPDAIYRKTDDRLFFKKLSSITAIFPGIDDIFREATAEETEKFLNLDFIITIDDYKCTNVKQANRKRIALAREAMESYDEDQKLAVFNSIREYYPSIVNDEKTFNIGSETDLSYLLFGILQRYYTTADGREKRIASTIRKL